MAFLVYPCWWTSNHQVLGSHQWQWQPCKYIPPPPRYVRWEPPETGIIKLNCDGSSRGDPGASGAGGLLRDSHGNWLCGFSYKIGFATAIEAELQAIRMGLDIAWKRKIPYIYVETDSKFAIGLLKEEDSEDHPLAALINECRDYLSRSWCISLILTPREGNRCADFMAKISHDLDQDQPFQLFSSPPPGLDRLLSDDATGVSFARPW